MPVWLRHNEHPEIALDRVTAFAFASERWRIKADTWGCKVSSMRMLSKMLCSPQEILALLDAFVAACKLMQHMLMANATAVRASIKKSFEARALTLPPAVRECDPSDELAMTNFLFNVDEFDAVDLRASLNRWLASSSASAHVTYSLLKHIFCYAVRHQTSLVAAWRNDTVQAFLERQFQLTLTERKPIHHLTALWSDHQHEDEQLKDAKLKRNRQSPRNVQRNSAYATTDKHDEVDVSAKSRSRDLLKSRINDLGRFPRGARPPLGNMCSTFHTTGKCSGGYSGCQTGATGKPYSHICPCPGQLVHPALQCPIFKEMCAGNHGRRRDGAQHEYDSEAYGPPPDRGNRRGGGRGGGPGGNHNYRGNSNYFARKNRKHHYRR
ncbi:MAG: hypothetical protein HRU13_14055 [Phycisphaerales bacterium]|nr:hypothetical protein [Phycisphaerales bacterium]